MLMRTNSQWQNVKRLADRTQDLAFSMAGQKSKPAADDMELHIGDKIQQSNGKVGPLLAGLVAGALAAGGAAYLLQPADPPPDTDPVVDTDTDTRRSIRFVD